MRVFISGCFGFVGRAFATRLLEDGYSVCGCDIVGSKHEDVRDYIKYVPADNFDLIIHCAAVVGGRRLIDGDPLLVANNIAIDSDVFYWVAKAEKKPKVIYFSSSAAYPAELQTRRMHCLLSESMQGFNARLGLPEMTSYGFTKLAGEYLAKVAREQHGVDVKVYRPFGGYGENQSLDYPFPSIIKRVVDRENPIVVWGSGEQQRDFIHIDDIVEAVLATYDKAWPFPALNLGTGIGTSFVQLAKMACAVAGHKAKIVADETKPEGVFARVADPFCLNQFYQPKISLTEGIEQALDKSKGAV